MRRNRLASLLRNKRRIGAFITTLFLITLVEGVSAAATYEKRFDRLSNTVLYACNFPETVLSPLTVINDTIQDDSPREIFYYYKNVSSVPLEVVVTLENVGANETTLAVVEGAAGPSEDGLYAGHMAVKKFWQSLLKGNEKDWVLPLNTSKVVFTQELKPNQLSTGVLLIEPKKQYSPYQLSFVIQDPLYPQLTRGVTSRFTVPQASVVTHQSAHRNLYLKMSKDEWIKELSIGDRPYGQNQSDKLQNKGNYGLVHRVHLSLDNPSDEVQQFQLLFSRTSGIARSVFVIDGTLVETQAFESTAQDKVETIATIDVEPLNARSVRIYVMPQGGGNYPAKLVVKRVRFGENV